VTLQKVQKYAKINVLKHSRLSLPRLRGPCFVALETSRGLQKPQRDFEYPGCALALPCKASALG